MLLCWYVILLLICCYITCCYVDMFILLLLCCNIVMLLCLSYPWRATILELHSIHWYPVISCDSSICVASFPMSLRPCEIPRIHTIRAGSQKGPKRVPKGSQKGPSVCRCLARTTMPKLPKFPSSPPKSEWPRKEVHQRDAHSSPQSFSHERCVSCHF